MLHNFLIKLAVFLLFIFSNGIHHHAFAQTSSVEEAPQANVTNTKSQAAPPQAMEKPIQAVVKNDPNETLAQIDSRIANTLHLLTWAIGAIPIVLLVAGFFRLKSIREVEENLEKKFSEKISFDARNTRDEIEEKITKKIIEEVITSINTHVKKQLSLQAKAYLLVGDIVHSYITNEIENETDGPKSISSSDLKELDEFQRTLRHLISGDAAVQHAGLIYINNICENLGMNTSALLLDFIFQLNENREFIDWNTRCLSEETITVLEQKTGLSIENDF